MKVELLTEWNDLEAVFPRWDELALQDKRDGFFRTSAWYRAWMEHIRPDARPFVIAVLDGTGKIVGLAPLCRLKYRDLGWRLNSICWAGREVVSGDFLDFVADCEVKHEATYAILQYLWGVRRQWSMLVLGELIEGGDSYSALERMGRLNGLPLRIQEERICPYIALPNSFEEYLTSLGSSTRYHVRRRVREVLDKHGARVETYSTPADVAERLDTLVRLHRSRWHKENLPGTLDRPGFAPFLRQICTRLPASAECRLHLLTHEGKDVAALLAFYFGESALYYQAGWDPDSALAAFSPTVVLMAQSIRAAIEHGLRYYEFLRGDESYKSHWTKTYRKTITIVVAQSFMAREYVRMARVKDSVKHLVLARQQRAGA